MTISESTGDARAREALLCERDRSDAPPFYDQTFWERLEGGWAPEPLLPRRGWVLALLLFAGLVLVGCFVGSRK